MSVAVRRAIFVLLPLIGATSIAGCAAVAPWERGVLAKPQMAVDPHPLQSALARHIHDSREAAPGGSAGQGGGCGCN